MKILFQGDSITDAIRSREQDEYMGSGYATMVAGELGCKYPGECEFVNRGISGNRIVDVYARIKCDIINLKPDVMSLLIGVNDVWHETGDSPNGVDADKFYKVYDMLIDEIKAACPDTKLIIIAPFILEGDGTRNTAQIPDKFERFKADVSEKAEVARKVSQKYKLPLIELQPAFDDACKKASAEYWTIDGVHPTPCGHEIIKRLWIETFKKIK